MPGALDPVLVSRAGSLGRSVLESAEIGGQGHGASRHHGDGQVRIEGPLRASLLRRPEPLLHLARRGPGVGRGGVDPSLLP